jgi:hypothetical protein
MDMVPIVIGIFGIAGIIAIIVLVTALLRPAQGWKGLRRED